MTIVTSTPLSMSFSRYSSNLAGSTSNARWFIVPMAVMPKRFCSDSPLTPSGAFGK